MIVDYIILALATFRLTRLITTDVIFNGVRERIWRRFSPGDGGLGYLITCDWCTSIWTASLVATMYTIATGPTVFVCGILALSAAVGLLNRVS